MEDETKYRLVSDLDASKTYRLDVSDDLEEYTTIECQDIFDKHWTHVFVYGEEVDDFQVYDKQKLFALDFSATQELARKMEEKDSQIAAANQEIATANQEIAAANQEIAAANEAIAAANQQIADLQSQVADLQQQVQTLFTLYQTV